MSVVGVTELWFGRGGWFTHTPRCRNESYAAWAARLTPDNWGCWMDELGKRMTAEGTRTGRLYHVDWGLIGGIAWQ